MTPRQFHLLYDRHLQALAHQEMLHAFTTSAVINNAPFAREQDIPWTNFAPNHPAFSGGGAHVPDDDLTEDQDEARSEWLAKAQQLAAEMKQGGGVLMERIARGEGV